jgi:hypothetical protein
VNPLGEASALSLPFGLVGRHAVEAFACFLFRSFGAFKMLCGLDPRPGGLIQLSGRFFRAAAKFVAVFRASFSRNSGARVENRPRPPAYRDTASGGLPGRLVQIKFCAGQARRAGRQ